MVHREQEIKQLQGWAQTVLNLINKFEDGLKELGPLAAIEEAESRPASPDEDGFPPEEEVPSAAVATARALTSRARDLTAHRQGIAKLRQHFSKVFSLPQQFALSALFGHASFMQEMLHEQISDDHYTVESQLVPCFPLCWGACCSYSQKQSDFSGEMLSH